LLFQAVRYEPKGFSQRRPAASGTWVFSLDGVRRVLYRLPEVLAAAVGKTIWLVEGEKDADALAALGAAATTSPMGAGKWSDEYGDALAGANVALLPDNDAVGLSHAHRVAASLQGRAKRVRVVALPGLPPKGDISDWLAARGTLPALVQLAKAAPDWRPGDAPPADLPSTPDASPEWEPPVPFADASLPPFPLEALPPALAGFVSEVAASVQVPVDMAAMMALGIVAAAGARTCLVQVGETHQEPLNLFVAVVMEPGSRKSGTLDALAAPLREAEREMTAADLPRITEAAEARAIEEKRLAHLRKQAAKAKTGDEAAEKGREVADLAGALTTVPAAPRLLADDVTPEAAAKMAGEQGGTLAIVSAEGGLFGNLGGRYQNGQPNLDLFLHGHAGEPHRVDRKGSPPVFIARVCLTVLLAIQPGVLAALSDTPAFGERGLVARFLFSIPEDLVGTRFYSNRRIDAEARYAYHAAVKSIVGLPLAATEADPGARHLLRLDGQALSLWAQYADDVERRQAEGGDLRALKYWASKLAGAVARIAGGLHLAEHAGRGCPWTRPLAPATVAAAWAIGEYLIPHAQAAYGDMGEGADAKTARRLLKWVLRTGPAEFTLRDCHQAHRSLTHAALAAALGLLCERGFLRQAEGAKRPGAGRPKAPAYQVNPLIGDAQKDAQKPLQLTTQNTQNTPN